MKSTDWLRSIELAFSVTSWPSSGYETLVSHSASASFDSLSCFLLIGSDQKLRLLAYRNSGVNVLDIAGATLSLDTAYHVIVNLNQGTDTCTIYVDDASYASGSPSQSWQLSTSSGANLRVGHSQRTHGYFHGVIDNVSFWTSEQDAAQRADHFLRGGIA